MATDNKRIAKNTLYLYFRYMVTIVVSLYTSRIILQSLGASDYGIYGAVGGIVGFLGFLNGALATASSRFITYALGEKDEQKAERTFITTLTIHVGLGLLLAVLAEILGIWLIYHEFQFPPERLDAAFWALQFSVITVAIGVSQVPYTACFVAHENMGIIAYTAVADVILRLTIATSLFYYGGDKLIFFALLICLQNVGFMMFYRLYCGVHYKEAKTRLGLDHELLRQIAKFSGWSLINNFAYSLAGQGITMMFAAFFNPTIVAAKTISVRVNTMTTQFIGLFRQAANPQIVKQYACGDYDAFINLTMMSAKYSYFIMWVMTLPILLLAAPLLKLWLSDVPEYSAIFVQLIMIDTLFWLFDASFNQGIVAIGNLKWATIWTTVCNFLRFPLVYLLFKFGFSPETSFYVSIIAGAILGCWVIPAVLRRLVHIEWKVFLNIYANCLIVSVVSSVIPVLSLFFLDKNTIPGFVLIGFISVGSAILSILYIGMEKDMRQKLYAIALKKIKFKNV